MNGGRHNVEINSTPQLVRRAHVTIKTEIMPHTKPRRSTLNFILHHRICNPFLNEQKNEWRGKDLISTLSSPLG